MIFFVFRGQILCKVVRCKYGEFQNTFQIFFNIFFAFPTNCTSLPMKYMASFLKVANLISFCQ